MIMVTPNNSKAMKTIIKHIGLLSVITLVAVAACHRFNPEDEMIKTIDVPQCLKPVTVKTVVEFNTVTLDLKVFPDAETYILEVYSSAFDEEIEPDPEDLVETYSIDAKNIPFKFTTLEDLTLYYRIASTNETKGKKQSLWTLGKFKTSVDPTTICITPTPELKECFEQIWFNWPTATTDKYLLEVYSSSIPSTGDPDPANLIKSIPLTNEELPHTEKFAVKDGSYYYRVKAIDLAGERKDSKWAKGSFATEEFSWPNEEKSVDYNLTAPFVDNYAEPARTEIKALFTGSSTSVPAGDPICYNKIYYMPEIAYMNDRMSTRGNGKYTSEEEYGVVLPTEKRYIFFYINRPGQFKAILRKYDETEFSKGTVALLTTKKGYGTKAIYLFDSGAISTGKGDPTVVDVKEEDLYGITEPAQIIIFNSGKTKALYIYPITWTPWNLLNND